MGIEDSMRRAGDEVTGRAKEMWGDLTDNERLEAEGKIDQAKAQAGKAGEAVKDGAREVGESATEIGRDFTGDPKS